MISRLRYRETLKVRVSLGNKAAATVICTSPRFGHPHYIPKTLVILAYPSFITLAICVRVRVTGDIHITRVLGMGMPKTRGCPYHCDTALTFIHTSPLRAPSRIRPPLFPDNLPYSSHKLLLAPTTPTLSVHSPFLPSWAGP